MLHIKTIYKEASEDDPYSKPFGSVCIQLTTDTVGVYKEYPMGHTYSDTDQLELVKEAIEKSLTLLKESK